MPEIEVYSRSHCGPCVLAKRLLEQKGVAFIEHDLGDDRSLTAEMIGRSGGLITVPQIFIGGRHIGGYAELAGLERRGALDAMLSG